MSEDAEGLLPVERKPGTFVEGHPRVGGRKRGSRNRRTIAALELMEKLEQELGRSVDPFEGLLRHSVDESLPLDVRIDCKKALLPYLLPRLQSLAVSGADGEGPVEVDSLTISAILASPEAVELSQQLALRLADARRGGQPPMQRALPSGPVDPLTTLEKQPNGHWGK